MTNQNIVLPAIALRGTTILPGMIVHFDVSRERSVKAIEAAMLHDQKIFLVTQIDPEVESPDLAGVYHVGTIAYIKQVVKLPQNLLRVLVEGTGRDTALSVHNRKHSANTGCGPSAAIFHYHTGFAHSQSSTVITVSGKNGQITADSSADHTLHIAFKE